VKSLVFNLIEEFDFIHIWSVTLVNTIKTTSFTSPSVIKLYLYVCIRLYMFRFLANHLQKAHQHCKGNYQYMIHKYIKLVPTDFHVQVEMCLIQQQEDQINTKDNLPSIEEATEREPCGLRIF
jgi:hypothetical protein